MLGIVGGGGLEGSEKKREPEGGRAEEGKCRMGVGTVAMVTSAPGTPNAGAGLDICHVRDQGFIALIGSPPLGKSHSSESEHSFSFNPWPLEPKVLGWQVM